MELSQADKIQKPKMQELSSLFMTHRLNVMYAPVNFMNILHTVWELWPGHEVGRTDGQMDGQTDVRDVQGYYLMPIRYSSNRWGHNEILELFSLVSKRNKKKYQYFFAG